MRYQDGKQLLTITTTPLTVPNHTPCSSAAPADIELTEEEKEKLRLAHVKRQQKNMEVAFQRRFKTYLRQKQQQKQRRRKKRKGKSK